MPWLGSTHDHDAVAVAASVARRNSTRTMSAALMALVLRRAQGHRPGDWNSDDFDVLDDGREVGRIYGINAATEIWWWGVSFMLTRRKSYGRGAHARASNGSVQGGVRALAQGAAKDLTGGSGGPDPGMTAEELSGLPAFPGN